ncbi:TonB-dependent receptor plug domain-containing protein [uncultured Spirosoma sp.]|uniref:TonB-dependent receptor plug domain-containing protein n=1 Tax=uncultured Spirosoma sp. TaxID=278208 RepID=UPI002583FE2F|nr:TonB-dependent receptor plug domain-containing protein [uncultured Spirosoma sp.]
MKTHGGFLGAIGLSLLAGWSVGALAQTTTSVSDSAVSLSAVTVRAIAPERFLAGQKLQRIDSTTLLQFRFSTITDLLTYNTPLAFRSYGPGQLATVAFRGTSANHTAVLWNGININQPNLGQTDFSTVPVAGFDKLAVQYGSGASAIGSDAVGGSILLGSQADWQTRLGVTVGQQLASFRNKQTQLGLRYSSAPGAAWQVSGRTYLYRSQLNNDYPYREFRNYFVDQATTAQRGLVQDVYVQHRNGRQLSVNAWLTDNDLILSPQDTVARERTRTQSSRLLTTYAAGTMTMRLGWIRDLMDYAKSDFTNPSHTETDRFIGRVEREFRLWPGLSRVTVNLRTGGEWSHYRTRTDGYGGQLITENRQDVYALLRLQTERWLVSANIRQAFVTRFNPPLTPSLGAEYKLRQRAQTTLTAKASIGRSYRVPTLNERYWVELGDPNLKPESGVNLEGGLALTSVLTPTLTLTTDLTAYRNRVDNWVLWNPATDYHVENLQLVLARGGELASTLTYTQAGWQAGVRLGYALTRTSQERAYDRYARDVLGKQLPYVPVHTGTLNAWVQRGRSRLSVQMQTSSRRYITADNTQYFRGVLLANLLAETQIRVAKAAFRVQGQVNNLFDALFISVRRNAMPGRSVAINVLFSLPSNHP